MYGLIITYFPTDKENKRCKEYTKQTFMHTKGTVTFSINVVKHRPRKTPTTA